MILGVGIDLIDVDRVTKANDKYGERFISKILSIKEKKIFNEIGTKDKKNNFLAKRFSVKESFLKALGLGLGRGIEFSDISVVNNLYGKPEINLSKKAKNIVENLYKSDRIIFNVSMTDEKNLINTITIISN